MKTKRNPFPSPNSHILRPSKLIVCELFCFSRRMTPTMHLGPTIITFTGKKDIDFGDFPEYDDTKIKKLHRVTITP